MKEPIYLQSEEALLGYFKRFLADLPKAVRLDGAVRAEKTQSAMGSVVAIFRFSIDGRRYKLLGSTTRQSIEEFVAIADEHGDASMALKTVDAGPGKGTLILSTRQGPEGWVCQPFSEKAKDSLKKAA